MANQWYFARDSKTCGPYSAGQLRAFAATGQLRPRDAVWKEGMENRVEAARVKDLFTPAQFHAQDTSLTTMQIQPGCARANCVCPKCRKSQPVEVQGVIA